MKTNKPLKAAILTAALLFLLILITPIEKTLGTGLRLIYLHGAWVWVAMLGFLASAVAGIAAFVLKKPQLHFWSRAFGISGTCFWLIFLPFSLLIMQLYWNGIYLNEPRFRVPLNLAVTAVVLQIGLAFLPTQWASIGNILFAGALFYTMSQIGSVLHPESPIFSSNALGIQIYFLAILILVSFLLWLFTQWLYQRTKDRRILL